LAERIYGEALGNLCKAAYARSGGYGPGSSLTKQQGSEAMELASSKLKAIDAAIDEMGIRILYEDKRLIGQAARIRGVQSCCSLLFCFQILARTLVIVMS
jgi:hypothetical protein